ncbi:MAG: xanthine dehydrogenase accessory protein XdhC [Hyphomicrobiales bacterium]
MSKVWQHVHSALSKGTDCALISVIATAGSTPREVGARIMLNSKGGFNGTIGGGNLENLSLEMARKMLTDKQARIHLQKHLLGPDMGQCCGGAVTVLIEVFTANQLDTIARFNELEMRGEFFTNTVVNANSVRREIVDTGEIVELKDNQFSEQFGLKKSPIYIFGAGHVGKALMLHLASLPFEITWVDNRKSEFPQAVPANFNLLCLNQPHKALLQAPDEAQILILTHDHDIDFEIVSVALQMDRFAYVGMIGSKTKKARFVSKFKKLGLSENQINTMVTPIGLPCITSKKPQAIAISVVADLLSRIEI